MSNYVRHRAKNFTTEEVNILMTEVEKRRHLLFGPLKGPSLTQFDRDRAWEQVLKLVIVVSPVPRKVEELKRKIKDLKTKVKAKVNAIVAESKKPGGGPDTALPLTDLEKKVLDFIGTESVEGAQSAVKKYDKKLNEKLQKSPSPQLSLLEFDIRSFPIKFEPQPPDFASEHSLSTDVDPLEPGPSRDHLSPEPSPATTGALDHLKKPTDSREETNKLLGKMIELLTERNRTFDVFASEFLSLKRREVECLEQSVAKKEKI